MRWARSLSSPSGALASGEVVEGVALAEGAAAELRRILWVVEPVRGRMVHTKLESVSWLRSEGIFCTVRAVVCVALS